jgi:signal transduction histidine kinase/ActR/RegA family two-component response regulator
MAQCLHEAKEYNGEEIVVARSDGARVLVQAHATPHFDDRARLIGAVNVLVDISDRKRAEEALRRSEAQLEAELASTKLLQDLSGELIHQENVAALYEKILDATVAVMHSDFASMQMFYAERGGGGELRLLAQRGFTPNAAKVWEWVRADTNCSSGTAFKTRCRAVVPDVEQCDYMAGTSELTSYRQAGMRAMQSTPLISRSGELLGIISTHWRKPHHPSERDLRLFDILARQAADLIERKQAESEIQALNAQLTSDMEAMARMQQVSLRLVQACDYARLLEEILDAAVAIAGTDMGNIQLLEQGNLKIVAQRGFQAPFLEFFNAVHDGQAACGTAMERGECVVVEDVANSSIFAGTPARKIMLEAKALAVQSMPLISRSGKLLGMFSTHWRQAPHQTTERQQRMLDLLARQAADLIERRQAEEALKEADRRKDEFLATLAHELRNPLAPIRNSLHILRLAGSDSGTAERVHEMMERQVGHMVRLVDELMEVSRITRGKIELRKEQVELADIIRSAVETSKPLIEAAGHQLAISLPAEPVTLEADPVRLTQVIANLLNNAAKFTKEGGQIWLDVRRKRSNAVVSVRDNGLGIPPDMLPKVFDLFTQLDRTYNRAQGGLGIGLTLVRSLVDMHGGSVEAKSDGPGQGSEFVVRLPLAVGKIGMYDRVESAGRLAPVVPRRILVVDDSRDAADSLGMLLKFLGADVLTANDGPAALEALKTYRPSVVLLDLGMPGMDGLEVARRARSQPEGRNVTLIALSGWGQEQDRRRSKEAGIDHHLVKPVDLSALEQLLAALSVTGKCQLTKKTPKLTEPGNGSAGTSPSDSVTRV